MHFNFNSNRLINKFFKFQNIIYMSQLENLEPTLLASRKISDFLKNFSETQWSRILKATVILGIQDLERNHAESYGGLQRIFPKDIEDIVVKNEEMLVQNQQQQAKLRKQEMSKK